MHPKRKRRLVTIIVLLVGVGSAAAFSLVALQRNINLFFSPSEVHSGNAPIRHTFRLGGLVVKDSVKREEKDLTVQFTVTDTKESVQVTYTGILPDLFREGQGIVAEGKLDDDGVFVATQVLAKHDENYMPPEVHEALQSAQNEDGNVGNDASGVQPEG